MRISTDPADPGHKEFLKAKEAGYRIVVLLDGRQMPHGMLITADEADGMVEGYELDAILKKPVYDPQNGNFKRTVLRGRVVIRRLHTGVPGLGMPARQSE